ncbi:MAG TPA: DegV family protein [Acidimicrobiales bacterium]|nr:DegV family protein [Acidimicrobiales bacterium]
MTTIVTDGAADLPQAERIPGNVVVVRGSVRIGSEPWHGDLREFWQEIGKGPELPATEAPTVAQLAAAYAGDEPVLAVHVSSELSRTLAHAEEAAAGVAGPVEVVDSRSLSVGTGLVVLAASEAADAGVVGERLRSMVDGWVDQLHVHGLIDDVGFLVHGERAGLVVAKVGRHAHRHVVAVKGHVIPIRQVRHRSEALRELSDHIREHVVGGVSRWAVGHGDAPDVDEFVERLAGVFGCDPSYVSLMGAPVGSHMGPRSLLVGFFSDS